MPFSPISFFYFEEARTEGERKWFKAPLLLDFFLAKSSLFM